MALSRFLRLCLLCLPCLLCLRLFCSAKAWISQRSSSACPLEQLSSASETVRLAASCSQKAAVPRHQVPAALLTSAVRTWGNARKRRRASCRSIPSATDWTSWLLHLHQSRGRSDGVVVVPPHVSVAQPRSGGNTGEPLWLGTLQLWRPAVSVQGRKNMAANLQ